MKTNENIMGVERVLPSTAQLGGFEGENNVTKISSTNEAEEVAKETESYKQEVQDSAQMAISLAAEDTQTEYDDSEYKIIRLDTAEKLMNTFSKDSVANNYGRWYENEIYYVPRGQYIINQPLYLCGRYLRFICDGTILYTGADCAIRCHSEYSDIRIDNIQTTNRIAIGFELTPYLAVIESSPQKPCYNRIHINYIGTNSDNYPAVGIHVYIPNYKRIRGETSITSGTGITYNQITAKDVKADLIPLFVNCQSKPSYINCNRFSIDKLEYGAIGCVIGTDEFDSNEPFSYDSSKSSWVTTSPDNGSNYCFFDYLNVEGLRSASGKLGTDGQTEVPEVVLNTYENSNGSSSGSAFRYLNCILPLYINCLYNKTVYKEQLDLARSIDSDWFDYTLTNDTTKKTGKTYYKLIYRESNVATQLPEFTTEQYDGVTDAELSLMSNNDLSWIEGDGYKYLICEHTPRIAILYKQALLSAIPYINADGYTDKTCVESVAKECVCLLQYAREGVGISLKKSRYNRIDYMKCIPGENNYSTLKKEIKHPFAFRHIVYANNLYIKSIDLDKVMFDQVSSDSNLNRINSDEMRISQQRIEGGCTFTNQGFSYLPLKCRCLSVTSSNVQNTGMPIKDGLTVLADTEQGTKLMPSYFNYETPYIVQFPDGSIKDRYLVLQSIFEVPNSTFTAHLKAGFNPKGITDSYGNIIVKDLANRSGTVSLKFITAGFDNSQFGHIYRIDSNGSIISSAKGLTVSTKPDASYDLVILFSGQGCLRVNNADAKDSGTTLVNDVAQATKFKLVRNSSIGNRLSLMSEDGEYLTVNNNQLEIKYSTVYNSYQFATWSNGESSNSYWTWDDGINDNHNVGDFKGNTIWEITENYN